MVRPCLLQSPQSPSITPHYSDFGTWWNTSSPRIQRVHTKDGFDATQLHASAFRGHNDVFLLLIEHFPDVDVRNGWDQTPLHATSYGGYLEIRKQLLDCCADVDDRDNVGWTPLYLAAACGQLLFARLLREHKAATDAAPNNARSELVDVRHVRLSLGHSRMGTCATNMAEPARSLRVNQHAKNKSNNT
jgi:ankyrin repeat protein